MRHFALMWAFIGRLTAIRAALDYDLSAAGISPVCVGPLWQTNMEAWKLTQGR